MLNSISIVGKISKEVYYVDDKAYIDIQVKRPCFLEIGKETWDDFSVQLWKGLEEMINDVGKIGTTLAIRGRLIINQQNTDDSILRYTVIYAEIIEIIDKYFYK